MNARLRWGKGIPASVRRWAFLIVPAARKYHISPNLIAAVMTMESEGDPLAWSAADARGLMQILHGPWDPKENVEMGARMLAELLEQFGSVKLALAAYNAGPNAVLSFQGVPPYRETRDYVIIVKYLYDLYNKHTLTSHRRAQYQATLKDLQHIREERRKVPALARAGHVKADFSLPSICDHLSPKCLQPDLDNDPVPATGHEARGVSDESPNPFWLVGGIPDPLQRVDPPIEKAG
jgi:hypothetical protein